MRRLFWVGVGAAVGVLVVRKLSRTAHQYTPEGMAESLAGLGAGLRDLAAAVREGMAEREEELRLALGMDTGTAPGGGPMDPGTARRLLEDPTGPVR